MKTIRFCLIIFFVLGFNTFGLTSKSYSQEMVVRVPFTKGMNNFADSTGLAKVLKEIGDFVFKHNDPNTIMIQLVICRSSDDERDFLWMERLEKLLKLIYELHPKYKTVLLSIRFDPAERPDREIYLTEDSEIGAAFWVLERK